MNPTDSGTATRHPGEPLMVPPTGTLAPEPPTRSVNG